ncbi:hypothetical protein H2201_004059, partial [Coniosporium apollinis]
TQEIQFFNILSPEVGGVRVGLQPSAAVDGTSISPPWETSSTSEDRNRNLPDAALMQLTAHPYSPILDFSGSAQEHRSLDFFHGQVATILSGYFDSTFWTHLLPRVGASEASVKHAMIALASLYETILNRERQSNQGQQRCTLLQYNKAIKSLKERLGAGEQALEITLLTCVLFICLEFMRGNPNVALDHLQSGLQILNTSQQPRVITLCSGSQTR